MSIIGLDLFDINAYESIMPRINTISKVKLNNAIYDEVMIRERVDVDYKNSTKDGWELDTFLLAQFKGDLEAGNINNGGIPIDRFAIKRRKVGETKNYILGYKDFVNNNQFVFTDYTQSNGDFIYSITPVGVNDLQGKDNPVNVTSDFAGWFVVDQKENMAIPFDKFIGSEPTITSNLQQSRVQIDTLTKYPNFFYTDQEFHDFQIQSVFAPNEWERSGDQYERLLNAMIRHHKPMLIKGGSGESYVVDIHSPSKSSPQNTYSRYDYMTLSVQATEIMDYDEYMDKVQKGLI